MTMKFVYVCKIVNDDMIVLSRDVQSLNEARTILKSMVTTIFSVDDLIDQAHFFSRRDIEFRIIDQLVDTIETDNEFSLNHCVRYMQKLSKDYNQCTNWRIEIEVIDWESWKKSQIVL